MATRERITLAIDPDLLERFDRLLEERGLGNRSEAVRDLIRARLVEEEVVEEEEGTGGGEAVGSLTLLYDHEQRELSEKLVEAGHHSTGAQVVASMHVHLDARLCLEVLALRGPVADLRHFADGVLGLKGVLHGRLVVSTPTVLGSAAGHGPGRHHHDHDHQQPHHDDRGPKPLGEATG